MMATATTTTPSMEIAKKTNTIQDLQQNKNLWYKMHVFVYDLRNFDKVATSHDRLESLLNASYIDALYIGAPYFTPDEAATLRATAVKGDKTLQTVIRETLEDRLLRRMKGKVGSGDHRVCAAHDLARIFEKAFFIDHERLAGDTKFLALVAAFRLFLPGGQEWDGLAGRRDIGIGAVRGRMRGRGRG
ncbi:hypothetical protein BLS_002428 [Venturia inaequalis]|uniref:Uncharacterized protein n=1 Tax=Venturia inaequalis TaxID=5025 RepID=A0A8H3Z5Z2_VENIN|nr:hypothetical protein BLS_002428 [Venturia inaequalis]